MPAKVSRGTSPRRRSRLWIVGVAGLCLVAYLYYRPVKSYISASRVLAAKQAEVRQLARDRAALEQRLAASEAGETMLEEARRLGYVRPGERLFIVRGLKEWQRAHRHAAPQ